MSRYRSALWLAAWGLVFLTAGSALAQEISNSTLKNMQFFDPSGPAAVSDGFGGGTAPNEGYFFSAEYLYWTIQRPGVTPVGHPGTRDVVLYPTSFDPATGDPFGGPPVTVTQENNVDTGMLTSDWVGGNRFELGDITGHHGWLLGHYNMRVQSQIREGNDMIMVINDREFGPQDRRHLDGFIPSVIVAPVTYTTPIIFGPLPLQFDQFRIESFVDTWSVEWMYMYRTHPLGFEKRWLAEMFMGVRYMEFEDRFNVFGGGSRFRFNDPTDPATAITGAGAILAESWWNTEADNRIVGPQLGMRLFTTRGRWTFSTEGRFFAGFNFQNVRQQGTLGSRLRDGFPQDIGPLEIPEGTVPFVPTVDQPTTFDHVFSANEFSPAIEYRVDARLHLTRGLSLKAGYSLLFMDGIARASNMIDYVWSENQVFGIRPENNRQYVLMNGLNVGFEINR